jgi:hypothetical protein
MQVFIVTPGGSKIYPKLIGPFTIFQAHPNGTDMIHHQQVTLKVRIDLSLGNEQSNVTKINMDMLKDLHGNSAQYLHSIHYLLDKLMFTKQGITGEKDFFKHL